MSDDKPERPQLGLSLAQVIGSALAAVSAALLASFAGTTGTIIGAAVGSVVFTVGGATYTWSLRRTSEAALRRAAQVRQRALATGILPRTVTDGPMRPADPHEGPVEPPAADSDHASENQQDEGGEADEAGPRLPWGKMLAASLALTVAVLGGITLVEAISGKPIASLLGRSDAQGTTVGNVVRSDAPAEQDPGTETPTDSPAPTQAPQPSAPAVPEPSTSTPSAVPPQEPSEPAEPSATTDP